MYVWILQDTCKLTFRAKNPVGIYAVSVMLEDFAPTDLTSPLSKIPLQFLFEILPNKGPCRQPRVLGGHGECVTVPAGQEMQHTILAQSSSPEFEYVTHSLFYVKCMYCGWNHYEETTT